MKDFYEKCDLLVVGAGLAGCEAAWRAARAGLSVVLADIKPEQFTPAHKYKGPAELVCSNSLGSMSEGTASAQLKREMRALDSVVLRAADTCAVPAGKSLAVNRERLSDEVGRLLGKVGVQTISKEFCEIPEAPCVLATGPLTTDALAQSLAGAAGGDDSLFYFDATSPIISADSIDRSIVFAASRYDKGDPDFLNCPMSEDEYKAFIRAIIEAEKVVPHEFEKNKLFEACMPIEDIALRGEMTAAFGPMRPVGLIDPRTDRRPFAVVQLRVEDAGGESLSLVGFQTRMKHPEQQRVFRMIPGLENAEFLRYGVIHRNTYLNSPEALDSLLQLKGKPGVFLAGQITGVEGYLESASSGILAGLLAIAQIQKHSISQPPITTMIGALHLHVTQSPHKPYTPMKANLGILPPPSGGKMPKKLRRLAKCEMATEEMRRWIEDHSIA